MYPCITVALTILCYIPFGSLLVTSSMPPPSLQEHQKDDLQPPPLFNKRIGATHILESPMSTKKTPKEEFSSEYWHNTAQTILKDKLNQKINRNKARNGIIFLGDGMSVTTLMAARVYLGQLVNKSGEEQKLSFENFPVSGLAKTYCIDAQVPDSACTATAYLTGVKTRYGTIGINGNVIRGNCSTQLDRRNHVTSIADWAIEQGLSAGIVTTTRVTHASPAGTYANIAERNWESDADMTDKAIMEGCQDIAFQLITENPGRQFQVIMGGGRSGFYPNLTKSDGGPTGKRQDNIDLVELWHIEKETTNKSHRYIRNRSELHMLMHDDEELPDYLLGLFHNEHMDFHLQAKDDQPTLAEMTELAIKILEKNPKGYFLFVEGGRIDHAHHKTYAQLALDETVEFSKAIQRAKDITSSEDTLIVVTSDHAHTMTISGYPSRGNDVLGTVDTAIGDDGISYSTISYANGEGYRAAVNGTRYDPSKDQHFVAHDLEYRYPALVPLDSETHGGEDVAIFADGPWQHLFTSTIEQNAIPHLVAYAMCLGEMKHDGCYGRTIKQEYNGSILIKGNYILLVLVILNLIYFS